MWNALPPSMVFNKRGLAQPPQCLSVTRSGQPANANVSAPTVSASGRFVAMTSQADNLAPGDTNHVTDVVLLDRQSGDYELISRTASGRAASEASMQASMSADGQKVAFLSLADDLSPPQTEHTENVFLRDRVSGALELISHSPTGSAANGRSASPRLSSDGNVVVYSSKATNLVAHDGNHWDDVFAYDRRTAVTELVSASSDGTQANGWSGPPVVSGDGNLVAFVSNAENLRAGESSPGVYSLYLRNRAMGTTRCLSGESPAAADSLAIAADGSVVAFLSKCSWPNPMMLHDVASNVSTPLPSYLGGFNITEAKQPALSADGRFVAVAAAVRDGAPRDVNNIFIYDRKSGNSACVSLDEAGQLADKTCLTPALSDDATTILWSGATAASPDEQVFMNRNPLHPSFASSRLEEMDSQTPEAPTETPTVRTDGEWVIVNGIRVPRRH